jgi:acyl-CoA thioester hydrolase
MKKMEKEIGKFERKINYYETDRMGIVHHSNYVRFLEEARCYWLEQVDLPYAVMEENGIAIPVLGVNCNFKHGVTYGDTIVIEMFKKEYNGVKLIVEYTVTNKATGTVVMTGETTHCFTTKERKPINLKKIAPEFSAKFEQL